MNIFGTEEYVYTDIKLFLPFYLPSNTEIQHEALLLLES